MTNFIDALQEKIDDLEDEKAHIDEKIDLLRELMEGETGKRGAAPPARAKRRAGRPKGAKNKKQAPSKHAVADDLYEEAMKNVEKLEDGGTSAELQASRTKSFNPAPRPLAPRAPNVHAGTKKDVDEARLGKKADATVSVDEADLEDD
jgi:hypothetical protein